jgi:hypothetical protein
MANNIGAPLARGRLNSEQESVEENWSEFSQWDIGKLCGSSGGTFIIWSYLIPTSHNLIIIIYYKLAWTLEGPASLLINHVGR